MPNHLLSKQPKYSERKRSVTRFHPSAFRCSSNRSTTFITEQPMQNNRPLTNQSTRRTLSASALAVVVIATTVIEPRNATPSPLPPPETPEVVAGDDMFPRPFTLRVDHDDLISIVGSVVGHNGKPVPNANIAVFVEHPDFLVPVLAPTVLHQSTADSEGRFSFKFASPNSYQCTRLCAIAGHSKHGFTVMELDLPRRSHEVEFRLKDEQAIHGHVIGSDGQKVVGLKVDLRSVSDGKTYTAFWPSNTFPLAWPGSALTNAEGNFTLRGVPRAPSSLNVSFQLDDKRFAPQGLSVNPADDGSVTLELKPSAIVSGQVVQQDSGLPLGHCWLLVVPNSIGQEGDLQQDGIPVQADAEGRFYVRCCPEKYLTVYVYPPEGQPYLAWVTDAQRWPAGKSEFDLRIEIPRGVLVRGKVVESTSGKPLAGAGVEYWVARDKNPHLSKDSVSKAYWAAEYRRILSDHEGNFDMVVIPGPGYLIAKAPDATYVSRQITHGELMWDKPGGYFINVEAAKSINPTPEVKVIDVVLEMKPGVTICGKVEGPDGQPAARVVVLSSSFTRIQSFYWSSRRELIVVDGKFELPGCDPTEPRTVFLLDAKTQSGATVIIRPDDAKDTPPVIRLKPCGWATVRLVDKQGKPRASQPLNAENLILRTDLIGMEGVNNPQYGTQALRHIRWGMPILDSDRHRSLQTDENGRVTFPTLIPDAPYKLIQISPSYKELMDFRVEPGMEHSLGTITIE